MDQIATLPTNIAPYEKQLKFFCLEEESEFVRIKSFVQGKKIVLIHVALRAEVPVHGPAPVRGEVQGAQGEGEKEEMVFIVPDKIIPTYQLTEDNKRRWFLEWVEEDRKSFKEQAELFVLQQIKHGYFYEIPEAIRGFMNQYKNLVKKQKIIQLNFKYFFCPEFENREVRKNHTIYSYQYSDIEKHVVHQKFKQLFFEIFYPFGPVNYLEKIFTLLLDTKIDMLYVLLLIDLRENKEQKKNILSSFLLKKNLNIYQYDIKCKKLSARSMKEEESEFQFIIFCTNNIRDNLNQFLNNLFSKFNNYYNNYWSIQDYIHKIISPNQ